MISSVNAMNTYAANANTQTTTPRITPKQNVSKGASDIAEFGKTPLSTGQSMQVVLDRAMEKLRAVVSDARAALGMSESDSIDTSPDATAQRIADFALGFFGKYAENNGLADDEAGRQQFADFIGGAIQKGIEEARGILTALSALNGEVDANINKTWETIQQRLDDFVKNGLGNPTQAV